MKGIASTLCVLSVALAAQPPKDVTGWGKIKWGMRVDEAKVALGDQAKPESEGSPYTTYPSKLRLQGVQIGNETGYAQIQTRRESDLVCMVTLVAAPPGAEKTPGQRAAIFEELKAMLVEKYGPPVNSDRKPSGSGFVDATVTWIFPSTSIRLLWSDESKYHIGHVAIEYKSVDKKALDTL